jgi:hypothetical protein
MPEGAEAGTWRAGHQKPQGGGDAVRGWCRVYGSQSFPHFGSSRCAKLGVFGIVHQACGTPSARLLDSLSPHR